MSDVKEEITYNEYGENDGVESEYTFKKRTLALIEKFKLETDDSPYAVDEMRNYPVLEDNQEIYLSKKSEKISEPPPFGWVIMKCK